MTFFRLFEDLMKEMETHPRHVFYTAQSIISAILNHNVVLDLGAFKVYPNTYIILVGPAGASRKSTALSFAQKEILEPVLAHLRLNNRDQGMPVIMSTATMQAVTRIMSGGMVAGQDPDEYPLPNHWGVRPIYFLCDELRVLLPDGREEARMLADFVTQGYHGAAFKGFTKTQNCDIVDPCIVSIVACTVPETITEVFSSELLSSGFGSRVQLIYEKQPRHRNAFPSVDQKLVQQLRTLLINIAGLRGNMRIQPEVKERYRVMYEEEGAFPLHDEDPSKFASRMPMHVLKHAMLNAAADCRMEIQMDDYEQAVIDVFKIYDTLPSLFRLVRRRSERAHVRLVENTIKESGTHGITLTELRQALRHHVKWESVLEVLEDLKAADKDSPSTITQGKRATGKVGRPATVLIHRAHTKEDSDAKSSE